MNAVHHPTLLPAPRRPERGFTLVELMVTVAIALFLLGGLVTIVQNTRQADINQRALSQLQDQERFALTVITDVVQAGGYVPDPTIYNPATSLPVLAPWEAGQAVYGTRVAPASDTLSVRYITAVGDGVILCDGSTNTANAPVGFYTNTFSMQQPPAVPAGQGGLYCQVNNGGLSAAAPGVLLAGGVVGMKVYYGVKRDFAYSDYNVDTYLTADQMCSPTLNPCGTDDWANLSSVRVILTFTNPLFPQPGQQPTITFERVIEVMARGGVHT